jgi:flagellar biosynthesis protein FlhG
MKWLSHRAGLLVYSLLMACNPQLRLATRIAQQLSSCADGFLGSVLRDWACMDPRASSTAPLTPELRHLARELLLAAPPGAAVEAASSDTMPLRPARATALRSVAIQ